MSVILGQFDISTFIECIFKLCNKRYFDCIKRIHIIQGLQKLKNVKMNFNDDDHPSVIEILSSDGKIIMM